MKKINAGVILIITLMAISGCSRFDPLRGAFGSYRNYNESNGEIKEGRYFDPEGRFSVEVPKLLQPGAVIQGGFTPEGGVVVFSDDFGTLIRVDVSTALTSEARSMFHYPDWRKMLSGIRECDGEKYRSVVPKARQIQSEFVSVQKHNAIFFTYFLPEGASLSENNKRLDAYRGTIAFVYGNSLFNVSTQHIKGLFGEDTAEKDIIEAMKTKLLLVVNSMKFNG